MSSRTKSGPRADQGRIALGGIAGWMIARLSSPKKSPPRLALLERITLGPRQSLALVEAEGRCLLVATSAEGSPAFYPLESGSGEEQPRAGRPAPHLLGRVSW